MEAILATNNDDKKMYDVTIHILIETANPEYAQEVSDAIVAQVSPIDWLGGVYGTVRRISPDSASKKYTAKEDTDDGSEQSSN
jgi:hypothetical protein